MWKGTAGTGRRPGISGPRWRNGRRAAFRAQYPYGCVGSNPSLGTNQFYGRVSAIVCACSSADRALPCGGRGREFESRQAHHPLPIIKPFAFRLCLTHRVSPSPSPLPPPSPLLWPSPSREEELLRQGFTPNPALRLRLRDRGKIIASRISESAGWRCLYRRCCPGSRCTPGGLPRRSSPSPAARHRGCTC